MDLRLRFTIILLLLLILLVIGMVGYSFIEGWSTLESFYMTIITLSTVGFSELKPLSDLGRIFTIILIILGIGTFFYGLTTITAAVVEGRVKEILRRRKMERNIASLKDHVIVCGTQETARPIIEELVKTKTPFVIVNYKVSTWLELLGYQHIMHIEGDPTEETILKKAGIDNAKGLIAALNNDTQNIFIVLTARELNPDLRIIARVSEKEAEQKFKRAGATATVCPNFTGGLRLASEIIRPAVVDFLDVMVRGKDLTLRIEQIDVHPKSKYVDQTLKQMDIAHKTGVIIVAKKDVGTGKYHYNPGANTRINAGDTLIALGEIEQIESLRKII